MSHPLYALSTAGLPWIEIDFPEDYQRAVNEVYPQIESQLSLDEAYLAQKRQEAKDSEAVYD